MFLKKHWGFSRCKKLSDFRRKKVKINIKLPTAAVLMLAVAIAVSAQADRLQDMVGDRASSAENRLEERGYISIHSDRSWSNSYAYWWSYRDKKCVVVKTNDGRVASIKNTSNGDCNQKDSDGLSTGAKVGIAAGAAAIIGAAIIAHKAHQHAEEKHYEDANKEAEFDRGYRDGLYNNSYHDYNSSEEYRSGYTSGVNQRNNEIPHSSGRGGNWPYVSLQDLVGARASAGENEMQTRGFRNVDGFKSGNASYTIWWNGRTRQCIQVATADGRYDSVTDIKTHPKCQ